MFGVLRVIVRHMTNEDVTVTPEPAELAEPVDPLAPDADAPYGYMIDPDSGERRAKKRPGRQRSAPVAPVTFSAGSPGLDELKATRPVQEPPEDRSPDALKSRPRGKRA